MNDYKQIINSHKLTFKRTFVILKANKVFHLAPVRTL